MNHKRIYLYRIRNEAHSLPYRRRHQRRLGTFRGKGGLLRQTDNASASAVNAWQMKDALRTVVDANGYSAWDIRQTYSGFRVELNEKLDEDAASSLCGQFPLSADYEGEGNHGTIFTLYP